MLLLEIILAIVLPPLGILLKEGLSKNLLICVVLTLLGWLPGVIFALYILLSGRRAAI